MKKYSFFKGFFKALINGLIFVGPMAITLLPETWANVTLSGAIYMLINYLKVKSSESALSSTD